MYHMRRLRPLGKRVIASNQLLSLLPLHSIHHKEKAAREIVGTSQTKHFHCLMLFKVTILCPNLSGGLPDLRRKGTCGGGSSLGGLLHALVDLWQFPLFGDLALQFVSALSGSGAGTEGVPSSAPISCHGARSDVDTVSSHPLGCLMYAYLTYIH